MAPYDGSEHVRVTAIGPEIVLDPATAQILALALHELATNAAKYGALSQHSGTVTLSWAIGAQGLVLQWTETGGPRTEVPMSRGYGTRVIKVAVEQQLGGQIDFDWRGEGLHCRVSIPRSKSIRHGIGPAAVQRDDFRRAARARRQCRASRRGRVAGCDDDGEHAVGGRLQGGRPSPSPRRSHAHRDGDGARRGSPRHQPCRRARLPARRSSGGAPVPFIFVTGYGAEGVHPRFAHVPVLQKPLGRGVIESAFALMGNGAGPLPGSPALGRRSEPRLERRHRLGEARRDGIGRRSASPASTAAIAIAVGTEL